MAEIQRKTINGINTVSMHGKNYVEVAERVRLVHEQKREFEVIESGPVQIGERCLWRVVVLVDGKRYTGNAEVKLQAKSGPDATNPFECGETSALGRALAFAGFGSVESIASFDEVYRATNGGSTNKTDEKATHQNDAPGPKIIYSEGKLKAMWKDSKEFLAAASVILEVPLNEKTVLTNDQRLRLYEAVQAS